jgi:DNA (cytosine-5)-methyltransferase 1
MKSTNSIPIVDLFAGPGGLGEGFSSLTGNPFRILVSAEMDPHAHATLRLRAFYRNLRRMDGDMLRSYYELCNHGTSLPDDPLIRTAWEEASSEALQLTLGKTEDNNRLDKIIREHSLDENTPWVLIGGPPCQAYSLVGRARNRGKSDYRPEDDHRHFLYREYLRIIQQYRPAVFVMENVKGILSSKIGGKHIFHSILEDLSDPDRAMGKERSRLGYRIHSLSIGDAVFKRGGDPQLIDARKFIVRAEEYGIPQARHRVILLGVREDISDERVGTLSKADSKCPLAVALAGLPALRSSLSKQTDSARSWQETIQKHFHELAEAAEDGNDVELAGRFVRMKSKISSRLTTGGLRVPRSATSPQGRDGLKSLHANSDLHFWLESMRNWYQDSNLSVWLNHEARGHMSLDLMRYAYAATFAQEYERSPKGHKEFNLIEKLRPLHANWESGKFSDRFRVQRLEVPATTITSHISKDGHYFIHPDPTQCRSLTVREAARVQTFPDNYFFQGNRTQQYHQVGNAVPPLLAYQIAEIVHTLLKGDTDKMKGLPRSKAHTKGQQLQVFDDIYS